MAEFEDFARSLGRAAAKALAQFDKHAMDFKLEALFSVPEAPADFVLRRLEREVVKLIGDHFPFPTEITAEVRSIDDEVDRLRGLLKRLEWAGKETEYAGSEDENTYDICPACEVPKDSQHHPYCWLGRELGR